MNLTSLERSMLRGDHGDAAREALEFQMKVGEFWNAKRFVPVTNVHMMGDIEVMGDAGLDWLRAVRARDGGCVVPVTTNARCIDFACAEQFGQRPGEVAKEREIVNVLQALNVKTTDTCIGYQAIYEPRFGERIAWGDTGTVIYANSVLGARSNFESGPAALAAGLTGRVAEYGFHLDAHRRGTFTVDVQANLGDVAEWGALGSIVGAARPGYFEVPVFAGVSGEPDSDQLKHLGAALASYGSMAMFHIVGVTPEAPTVEEAFRGRESAATITVGQSELEHALGAPPTDWTVRPCRVLRSAAFARGARETRQGIPWLSRPREHACLRDDGIGHPGGGEASGVRVRPRGRRRQSPGRRVLSTSFSTYPRYAPETSGGHSSRAPPSSSNTIGAHGFETVLRRTSDCVEIAIHGELR